MGVCIGLDMIFSHAVSSGTATFESAVLLERSQIWNGSYWGLLTGAFVHVTDQVYIASFQMLMNIVLFFILGAGIELVLGRQLLFALVFFGALVGNGAQLAMSDSPVLLGAGLGGVVYTLFGFMLVVRRGGNRVFRRVLHDGVIRFFMFWLVLGFCIDWFSPVVNVSWMRFPFMASEFILHLALVVLVCMMVVQFFGGMAWQGLTGWLSPRPATRFLIVTVLGAALITNALFWSIGHMAQMSGWLLGISVAHVFFLKRNRVVYGLLMILLAFLTVISVTWLPWSGPWQVFRATIALDRGEYPAALELFERQLPAETPKVLNGLAWLLATAEDDSVRDGERAIELGKRACVKTSWRVPEYVDTLAAAYAETGRWDIAEALQRLVCEWVVEDGRLEGARRDEYKYAFEQNLRKIERREKIRE